LPDHPAILDAPVGQGSYSEFRILFNSVLNYNDFKPPQ
jgi:hypothetical protein